MRGPYSLVFSGPRHPLPFVVTVETQDANANAMSQRQSLDCSLQQFGS